MKFFFVFILNIYIFEHLNILFKTKLLNAKTDLIKN